MSLTENFRVLLESMGRDDAAERSRKRIARVLGFVVARGKKRKEALWGEEGRVLGFLVLGLDNPAKKAQGQRFNQILGGPLFLGLGVKIFFFFFWEKVYRGS